MDVHNENPAVDENMQGEENYELIQEACQLPSGSVLDPLDTYSITAAEKSCFVVIMGATGSGKTTLVTSIYQQFLCGGFLDNYYFAGSKTLMAFEERAHYTRTVSNGLEPQTLRTPRGSINDILHLRIKDNQKNRNINLLLSDFSGEDFENAVANIEVARQDFNLVKSAKKIVVIVDGANIVTPRKRASEIQRAINILKTFFDGELTHNNVDVLIVLSKYDLTKDKVEEEYLESISESFVKQIPELKNRVGFLRVAAMPTNTDEVALGFGLNDLLDELLKDQIKKFEEENMPNLLSQFDLWGVNLVVK